MRKTKSVLVTGGTGFIGRATMIALKNSGWKISRAIRASSKDLKKGDISLDLTKPMDIFDLVNNFRFDAIVHLGAQVGWSGETSAEMFLPNIVSTGSLAFLAKQWDAHLVYASAAIVCGAKSSIVNSSSPINLDTDYARTKFLGEELIIASGCNHCILRIGGVFGADGPLHLGLNLAIINAIKGVLPIQIGHGSALRNYIYVQDVARSIVYSLQQGLQGTHLLAGSEVTSMNQMLKDLCSVFIDGRLPFCKDGPEATSKIIVPSKSLPKTLKFYDALVDIKSKFR